MVAAVLFSQRSSWSFVYREHSGGLHLHRSHGLESANSPQQSSSATQHLSPNHVFFGSAAAFLFSLVLEHGT